MTALKDLAEAGLKELDQICCTPRSCSDARNCLLNISAHQFAETWRENYSFQVMFVAFVALILETLRLQDSMH